MISDARRDDYAGALLVAIGAGAAILGSRYDLGTLTRMGPGFVPTALGLLLAAIGVALIWLNRRAVRTGQLRRGLEAHGIAAANDRPDGRVWACIVGGMLAFVLLARHAGLAPAIFGCVFIAARGDRAASWRSSLILALALTVFGLLLFAWLLQVQIPVFKGWS